MLDEIDHIARDTNYEPFEFLHQLLCGDGELAQDIQLSTWLSSNERIEIDLRLDSRVESAMSDETVFFPPSDRTGLADVVGLQLDRAFREEALLNKVRPYGVGEAAVLADRLHHRLDLLSHGAKQWFRRSGHESLRRR